jgi:hypothetical protein
MKVLVPVKRVIDFVELGDGKATITRRRAPQDRREAAGDRSGRPAPQRATLREVGDGAEARFQITRRTASTTDLRHRGPARNITWTCSDGGGGPTHTGM